MQCKSALERLYNFKENLLFAIKNSLDNVENSISFDLISYKNKFIDAMDDDLNTADALGVIFELVKDVNMNILGKSNTGGKTLRGILNLFCELTGVLGILYEEKRTEKSRRSDLQPDRRARGADQHPVFPLLFPTFCGKFSGQLPAHALRSAGGMIPFAPPHHFTKGKAPHEEVLSF